LSLADVVRQPAPGLDAPVKPRLGADGRALTYLQGPPGSIVRSLWLHDLEVGERWMLAAPADRTASADGVAVSREEELRRERLRERGAGITDYQAADDGTLLVPLNGQLLIGHADARRGALRPLLGIDGVLDARLSPDGRHVAYVCGGDVHLVSSRGDDARRLTQDAEPGVTNGLADYIAAEELDRHVGMWWSADGEQLAFVRVDERAVPTYLIQHLAEEQVRAEVHHYPFAGGPNARATLQLAGLDGTLIGPLELGMEPDDYLARVVAHPAGGWLVGVLPRAQRSLRWLRVERNGTTRELWVEHATPWLNLDHDTRVLADGRILRSTERTGFRHLELLTADGQPERQLTSGEWVVTEVVHVDETRGDVLFMATRDTVLERHLYTVALAGGEPRRLTEAPGWHHVTFSADGSVWADTWSALDHAPALAVRFRDAARAPIRIHEPSATASSLELAVPELREVKAADGATSLHAAVYHPEGSRTSSATPPPAVVWIYGGPHSQKVANDWALTVELHRQVLRQLGFVVVVVDNRGTFFRGLAFEAPLWRQLGEVEIADQAAAVDQLAAAGVLDPRRVGITGGSYGGFLTLMAMLRRPDLFRVGVAAAPVTEWRLYDTAYTERYLDTPAANIEGYDASSLLPRAVDLAGEALVVHGLVDENVHFRHTARFLAALAEADRDVELLVFPEERHGERRPAARRQRQRKALAFLCRHLGQPIPPGALADGA
jgi:dipeptidyl-peptidase-4